MAIVVKPRLVTHGVLAVGTAINLVLLQPEGQPNLQHLTTVLGIDSPDGFGLIVGPAHQKRSQILRPCFRRSGGLSWLAFGFFFALHSFILTEVWASGQISLWSAPGFRFDRIKNPQMEKIFNL